MNFNIANPDTFTQGNASVATSTTAIIPANSVAKYRGITNDGVEMIQKQSDEIKRLNAVLIDMTNNAKRFGWNEGR